MHREEFDMFVQEVNQYVYELSNQSRSQSKPKNFELAILSLPGGISKTLFIVFKKFKLLLSSPETFH